MPEVRTSSWATRAQSLAATRGLPRLIVAVHRAGIPVFSVTVGAATDASTHRAEGGGGPLGDVFRVASISKIVTAATVLTLELDGRLAIDDPVASYVPAFPSRDVTIRQLLVHGSGLQREAPGETGWTTGTFLKDDDVEHAVSAAQFVAPPMTRWKYSNLGYNVLGRVASRAANARFEDLASAAVLRPLGMAASSWDPPAESSAALAGGHRRRPDGSVEPDPWAASRVPAPAGGLYSTAGDLGRLAAFITGHFPGPLAGDSLAGMQRPVLTVDDNPSQGQAIGPLVIHGPSGPRLGHAGGLSGYGSFLLAGLASGVSVVALTNLGDADALFDLCAATLDEAEATPGLAVAAPLQDMPVDLAPTLGTYWGDGTRLVIAWEHKDLVARWQGASGDLSAPMRVKVDGSRLVSDGGPFVGEPIDVERGVDGQIVGLRVSGYRFERV